VLKSLKASFPTGEIEVDAVHDELGSMRDILTLNTLEAMRSMLTVKRMGFSSDGTNFSVVQPLPEEAKSK
jgi:hypothetical protein